MGREVVHDDHVAGPQRGRQHALDVDAKDLAVHRAVDGERRGQAVESDRRHGGHHLPMPLRCIADAAPAAVAAAISSHQIGQRAALEVMFAVIRQSVSRINA